MFFVFQRTVFQVLGSLTQVLLIIWPFSSDHFSSYNPCSRDKIKIKIKIKAVDGTLAIVASQGKIPLTSALTLKFMSHVPKLSVNPHQFIKLLKIWTVQSPFSHLIVWSRTKTQGGQLGMLRNKRVCTCLNPVLAVVIVWYSQFSEKLSLNKAQRWLHHLHLGHPSFLCSKKCSFIIQ